MKRVQFRIASCGWFGALLAMTGSASAYPKPDEPAHGWLPTPKFTSPALYQVFQPGPALQVSLKASIPKIGNPKGVPAPFDFVTYAKASPYTEKWHIRVFKAGPGETRIFLDSYSGVIDGESFGVVLDSKWFAKHGPGKYGAWARVSQSTPKTTYEGIDTGVGFQIAVPVVKNNLAQQKVGGLVLPSEAGRLSQLPAPAAPPGHAARQNAPPSALSPTPPPQR